MVGIFKSVFTFLESYEHVGEVSAMLNAPTRRHELYRQKLRREKQTAVFEKNHGPIEDLLIKMYDVGVSYKNKGTGERTTIFKALQIDIEPGQVVAVMADGSMGKNTFLRCWRDNKCCGNACHGMH